MIGTILPSTISITEILIKLFQEGKESKELKTAIRDRLRREVSYNLAIFKLLQGKKKNILPVIISNLKTAAAEELVTLPFPVDKILDQELSDNTKAGLAYNSNKNYAKWSENIKTEKDLLERLFLRMNVARIRVNHEAGTGDIGYLKLLMSTFE